MGILEFNNVSKGYGDTPVLRNLSLQIKEGEFLAILPLVERLQVVVNHTPRSVGGGGRRRAPGAPGFGRG